ncbi:head decoration protein [Halomonas elongata]|uniref:Head decoration protein n=1 Tax=Halomonas elongata (strain ATCC 33173 / DSM 2581 / NBRC 15536 / NCIMB 2198 / 1H9) TaxID=768066 RepID=E1VAW9_HALED|nr:head decoration protein [Halomonas elongata]WBF17824.1 head decoration protein [Halomonas elongata]WPU46669.1 head decoration protein [Halomonas elongata DSM 2581]CBV44068.1 phage head decoration protein D [Halomonas elongata DSM 2581]
MPGMTQTNHPDRNGISGGNFPRRYMTVTIEAGQVQPAGAVLGKVTASNEYKLSASAAGDGSESPSVVLFDDVDASGGAVEAEVQISGDLRGEKLTIGTGHTIASVREALRPLSLFVD